jgi:hypothetical protein
MVVAPEFAFMRFTTNVSAKDKTVSMKVFGNFLNLEYRPNTFWLNMSTRNNSAKKEGDCRKNYGS